MARFTKHQQENSMTIQIGDRLPEGTLAEFIENETAGCTLGPNTFQVADLVKGKKIVIFGLPGAYTPTCSAQHVPGFVKNAEALKAKGVDEMALYIRQVAKENNVETLTLPPLARAIYNTSQVQQQIPAQLYQAVSQVLNYVLQLNAFRAGRRQAPPRFPNEMDVPSHLSEKKE